MTAARRSEGPRAPLFYGVAWLALQIGVAPAQTIDMSDLELCESLETLELKLACFEAIIAIGRASTEPSPVPDPVPTPVPEVNPAVDRKISEVEVDPEPVPAATPSLAQTSASIPAEPVDNFGQEHLDRPAMEEKEVITATVTEVTRGRNRTLYFHLANGHVWRQIEPRFVPYPKDGEFEINITRGMMGDYRMRIGDNGRMVRIRRVQ